MPWRILEFLSVAQLVVGTEGNYACLMATISFIKAGVKITLKVPVEDSPSNAGIEAVREMWKIAFSMQIEKGMASEFNIE